VGWGAGGGVKGWMGRVGLGMGSGGWDDGVWGGRRGRGRGRLGAGRGSGGGLGR